MLTLLLLLSCAEVEPIDSGAPVTDGDGDGYDDVALGGDDCDDGDADVYPGASDDCDGEDNDCDDAVDEDGLLTWYVDGDRDGYGDADVEFESCSPPTGYVSNADDCDDADGDSHPSAEEIPYDGADNDCDPETSDADFDGDGYDADSLGGEDCDDFDARIYPGAEEVCGRDGNCDGLQDDDLDGDGFQSEPCGGTDCDDTDGSVHPGAGCEQPISCLDIMNLGISSGSGVYVIDTDGEDAGEEPFEVWCDMSVDGGGWTLLQRTVWDWSESEALLTGYEDWYTQTIGSPEEGQAFRVAGQHWGALNGLLDHMVVHRARDAADDGTTCDPLYYRGANGAFSIDAAEAYLTGLKMPVDLINNEALSTTDSGPAEDCVAEDAAPWFYSTCCATCPTFGGDRWADEAHPMADYLADAPDDRGSTTAEVCPSGAGVVDALEGSFVGVQIMEYYVR